jgi:hypothetical protein
MNVKRIFVQRVAAVVVAAAVLFGSGARAGAATRNAIPGFHHVAASQQMPVWCWAACIQMALGTAGIHVTQADVVAANYGQVVNLPAFSLEQIAASLRVRAPGAGGTVVVDSASYYRPLTPAEIAYFVDRGSPIIAAIGDGNPYTPPAHVVMIYGYEAAPEYGAFVFHYFDPWPGKGYGSADYRAAGQWEQTVVAAVRHV